MNKVILVDDEMFFRKGLRNLINWEDCGFKVVGEAANGEDALQMMHEVNPDLIITDIRMPVLDGIGLIKQAIEIERVQTKFIIISGHSDFKYAQQALRYGVYDFVLKPIDQDEIEQTLRSLSNTINEQKKLHEQRLEEQAKIVFNHLLLGNAADNAHSVDLLNLLSVGNPNEFIYLLIEVNGILGESTLNNEERVRRIQLTLANVIQDVCSSHERIWIQKAGQCAVGVLITSNHLARFQMSIKKFMTWVKKELTNRLSEDFTFYVGEAVPSLTLLKQSADGVEMAKQHKYTNNENGIIIFEDIVDKPISFAEPDETIYQSLVEHIEEESTTQIILSLETLFQSLVSKNLSHTAFLASLNSFVHSVLKIIRKMGGEPSSLHSYRIIYTLHNYNLTLPQLKELIINFMIECKDEISKLRKQSANGEVHKIKQYIDFHYHENISLKTIARKFFMNPVYLGQLFKKTYGIYFKDYLLQVRINEAKKMLRQSEKRIYEIAECVGFNNTDYFVTIFGKFENITPSEYRNKLMNERNVIGK
ncbi:two-component system response regulator YesN [Neobacillus niacini]|uniref:response regulator n=1 Tax=Neobacillus niacini TaxID=86668 RepID=UPI002785B88D|nr:response regulator [Neobacillus niacini]MDQ1003303.1 two-component system response regulator YesN [Neobacillus niacini]